MALQVLTDSNYISESQRIKIKSEYLDLINNPEIIKELEKFNKIENRLDFFLMNMYI